MRNIRNIQDIPLNGYDVVEKYAGGLFLDGFSLAKSEDYADQLVGRIQNFLDYNDWVSIDRAVDVLNSSNSELQVKFFVKDANDVERSKTWAGQSPVAAIADTLLPILKWVQNHGKEVLVIAGAPIAGYVIGTVAAGMALPVVASFAPIAVPFAAVVYLSLAICKERIEAAEAISRWIDSPKTMVAVSNDADLMSLAERDHLALWKYKRTSDF